MIYDMIWWKHHQYYVQSIQYHLPTKFLLFVYRSVRTVVEFHCVIEEIQYTFAFKWASSKELVIFSLQSKFVLGQNKLIILKMIFVLEYQTRRITFSNNIFSFIQTPQILFNKNVPYFCRFSTKLSGMISGNPLRTFIWI